MRRAAVQNLDRGVFQEGLDRLLLERPVRDLAGLSRPQMQNLAAREGELQRFERFVAYGLHRLPPRRSGMPPALSQNDPVFVEIEEEGRQRRPLAAGRREETEASDSSFGRSRR